MELTAGEPAEEAPAEATMAWEAMSRKRKALESEQQEQLLASLAATSQTAVSMAQAARREGSRTPRRQKTGPDSMDVLSLPELAKRASGNEPTALTDARGLGQKLWMVEPRTQGIWLGLWTSLPGRHMPLGISAPEMDQGPCGHSVTQEDDYVSPQTARVLALQLELSVSLRNFNRWSEDFWTDARIEADDGEDHSAHGAPGDFSCGLVHPPDGASWRMDSWPGVEPQDGGQFREIETAVGGICLSDQGPTELTDAQNVHSMGHVGHCTFVPEPCDLQPLMSTDPLVKGGSC